MDGWWRNSVAAGLCLAAAHLGAASGADAHRNAVALLPYYSDFPGGELSLERLYGRRRSVRLLVDYAPRHYSDGSSTERIGGGLGLRWYWTGSRPMEGAFGGIRALAYHTDDYLYASGGIQSYAFTTAGGGTDLGWRLPLFDAWRVDIVGSLDWLIGDRRDPGYVTWIDANGNRNFADLSTDATEPGGRVHLNAHFGIGRTF